VTKLTIDLGISIHSMQDIAENKTKLREKVIMRAWKSQQIK
jgi:hypothetical protein